MKFHPTEVKAMEGSFEKQKISIMNLLELSRHLKLKTGTDADVDKEKLLNNNLATITPKKSHLLKKSPWRKVVSSSSTSGTTGTGSPASNSAARMDLIKLLAINALEFTAPASAAFFLTPPQSSTDTTTNNNKVSNTNLNINASGTPRNIILETTTTSACDSETGRENCRDEIIDKTTEDGHTVHHIRRSFVQLSGHPGCFAPAGPITLWKKQAEGSYEADVYDFLSNSEDTMKRAIPSYHSRTEWNGETFLEIEDLLTGFESDAAVMDLKIGFRTFLESEVKNSTERPDLYEKMIKVDPSAPTPQEQEKKAVTKLRYMQFREEQSSTSTLGYRIEAVKFRSSKEPVNDLKTTKTEAEIKDIMSKFLPENPVLKSQLISRLNDIRDALESSDFFMTHEVIGSSVLLIHDSQRAGAWLIDFAKTVPSPVGRLSHRKKWEMGNHEDGYLCGLDSLITVVESTA